jgi:hypothetical protein
MHPCYLGCKGEVGYIILCLFVFNLIEWLAKTTRAPSKSYLGIMIVERLYSVCSLLFDCFSRFGGVDINFDSSYFQAHPSSAVYVQELK